jgi:hypothetical protein
VVTVTRGKFRPAFDPVQPGDEQLFVSYLTLTHGRGLARKLGALKTLIGVLISKRQRARSARADSAAL